MSKNDNNDTKKKESKKMKNIISLVILLVGLLGGSLFIDVVQLLKGEGISPRSLSGTDIFELGGKTWVSYTDPLVTMQVINDQDCEACNVDEALVGIRRVMPTVLAKNVEDDSLEGQDLIQELSIRSLPAFVFSKEIKDLAFYSQAQDVFDEVGDHHVLSATKIGLQPGKYLTLPEIAEDDIVIGNPEASVTIFEFSEYQCPFCKKYHPTINQALEEFEGKVKYVFKHLPLNFHANARPASIAAECAGEQDKFKEYGDALFENQETWSELEDPKEEFQKYAGGLSLDLVEFGKCMEEERADDKITRHSLEAAEFGISGTPGTFVNDTFLGGAVEYAELKKIIEEKLGISVETEEATDELDPEIEAELEAFEGEAEETIDEETEAVE